MHKNITICLPEYFRKNVDQFCEDFGLTPSYLIRHSLCYMDKTLRNPVVQDETKRYFKIYTRHMKKFRKSMTPRIGGILLPEHIAYVTMMQKFFGTRNASNILRYAIDCYMTNIRYTEKRNQVKQKENDTHEH